MASPVRTRQPRVLLVGHEATPTGAPRMLLKIGAEAAATHELEVLLRRGGPIGEDFARLGRTSVLITEAEYSRYLGESRLSRLLRRELQWPLRLRRFLRAHRGAFDLIHNNTTANGTLLRSLRELNCPIVTHVHETADAIGKFVDADDWHASLRNSDYLIAVSEAVRCDLCDVYGVPRERVRLVPNFLSALPELPVLMEGQQLRTKLGISEGTRLVVGCGTSHPVKGSDLFEAVATRVAQMSARATAFLWFDASGGTRFRAGGPAQVVRGGEFSVQQLLGAADVVAVPSRTESFSLIALEAAGLGKPVVAFRGARGPVDVLGGAPALLASDHNVDQFAERVHALLVDAGAAERVGVSLRTRVAALYLAETRAAEIRALWAEAMARGRSPSRLRS